MALAIRFDDLIRNGQIKDYAEIARLGYVTRARVTQIMNLLHLAPDIQEAVLRLPPSSCGRDSTNERALRHIAALKDWQKQRVSWRAIAGSEPPKP